MGMSSLPEKAGIENEHAAFTRHERSPDSPDGGLTVDPSTERAITRKLDLHLMPWLFGIWLLAFIDRSNIGNARIQGLSTDLALDADNRFNVALAVFYVLYVLVDVPSNWVLKHVGGGRWLPGLLLAWGLVTTCMGLTKSFGGLVACRLLLGLFEGGLFGGLILYLSMFYRRHAILTRMGFWYSAGPLSGAIGGLLAAGLSRIHYNGYNGWPWIFIIEGAFTVVYGAVVLFVLPHTPAQARFLAAEQREAAVQLMHADAHGSGAASKVDSEKFGWRWVRMAVLNVNTALCCVNFLLILVPIYSYSLFLPTIINDLGYTALTAQLLTVPPQMAGFFSVLGVCWASDRLKMRGPFIAGGCLIAAVGYIMLLAGDAPAVRYGGTFLVTIGSTPSSPLVTGWLNNNLAPHYARATGTGLQVGIGNCGAFIATFTYLQKDAYVELTTLLGYVLTVRRPKYVVGHSINLGALGLILILTLTTMAYCSLENSKRAKGQRDGRLQEGDPALLGYRHPSFRYTL